MTIREALDAYDAAIAKFEEAWTEDAKEGISSARAAIIAIHDRETGDQYKRGYADGLREGRRGE